ncbi:hypothetical protein [Streptomyces sp. NPDC017529]|uniref:hypothetical protein n=1 Tax=Streptomyces sp. NPDC017529 TaxID=3365000 RepID=UPI0037AC1FA6
MGADVLPGVVAERLVDVVAVDPGDFGERAVGQADPDLADVVGIVVDLPFPTPGADSRLSVRGLFILVF